MDITISQIQSGRQMTVRIILFLGVCYIGLLLSFLPAEISFSEDSGIKTLMVKQYARGEFQSTLSLNGPDWIEQLWDQGLYPFRKPFVYDLPQGKTVVFPPLFQIISTPFYSVFGFRGLYIIPALATFILWLVFIKFCRTLNINSKIVQIALVAFIFSSSLTIYSAIFWEHTLTSLLCFVGLYYLTQSSMPNCNQNKTIALLYGLATGLSLWLRPEALIILVAFITWSLYWICTTEMKFIQFFVYGIALSIFGFLIFNTIVFESPLGLRSKQIVDGFDTVQRLKDGGYIFIVLCVKTILYDPISLLVIVLIWIYFKSSYQEIIKDRALSPVHLILLLIVIFYISAPWLLPNTGGHNWGIRYSLVCTPFIYILAIILGNQFLLNTKSIKAIVWLTVVLIMAGIVRNSVMGAEMLYKNYNGPKNSVLQYLITNKPEVVLITKSYHAGEFECIMPQSNIILTDTDELLQKFIHGHESQFSRAILIYDTNNTYSKLPLKESDLHPFIFQESFSNFKIYKYYPD